MSRLDPHLDGERLEAALRNALAIKNEDVRAQALIGLAPQLEGERLEAAQRAALEIKDEDWRARALIGLAGKLYLPAQVRRVRIAILDLFAGALGGYRSAVLSILGIPNLATPRLLGLSQAEFSIIADSVTSITTQWHWL